MNPQENTEKLIREFVLPGNKAADERIVNDAMAAYEKQKLAAIEPNIWRTIIKSRITKLAAAAVIVISISFLIVLLNPNKQADTAKTAQSHISPAELTTFASLSFAYREGGMEMVEQMCDKALTMAGPRPASISMQDLLE